MKKKISHEAGSGNVFADLGLAGAKERQVKVQLAMMIADLLKRRKLSQKEAAALLGTTQPRVSSIVSYKLKEISLEKLLEFLTRLDRDVEITIRPKPRNHTTGEVMVAL